MCLLRIEANAGEYRHWNVSGESSEKTCDQCNERTEADRDRDSTINSTNFYWSDHQIGSRMEESAASSSATTKLRVWVCVCVGHVSVCVRVCVGCICSPASRCLDLEKLAHLFKSFWNFLLIFFRRGNTLNISIIIKLLICFQEIRMFQAKSHLPAGLLERERQRERTTCSACERACRTTDC